MAKRKTGTAGWAPETRQRAAKLLIELNDDLGKEITPRIRWIADGGEIRALRDKKRGEAVASSPQHPASSPG